MIVCGGGWSRRKLLLISLLIRLLPDTAPLKELHGVDGLVRAHTWSLPCLALQLLRMRRDE